MLRRKIKILSVIAKCLHLKLDLRPTGALKYHQLTTVKVLALQSSGSYPRTTTPIGFNQTWTSSWSGKHVITRQLATTLTMSNRSILIYPYSTNNKTLALSTIQISSWQLAVIAEESMLPWKSNLLCRQWRARFQMQAQTGTSCAIIRSTRCQTMMRQLSRLMSAKSRHAYPSLTRTSRWGPRRRKSWPTALKGLRSLPEMEAPHLPPSSQFLVRRTNSKLR